MMKALFLSPLLVLLCACAADTVPADGTASAGQSKTANQIGQAATTPLTDLNLVKAPIPPALAAAVKAPYGAPADRSCASLTADVHALDAALGADLDTP